MEYAWWYRIILLMLHNMAAPPPPCPHLNCLSDTYYILHIYCALMRQKHRQLWHNLVYLAEPRRIDKKMKIKANKKSTYYINYDNDYVSRHININKKWLSHTWETMILLKCAHDGGHPVRELQTNILEDYPKISHNHALWQLRHYKDTILNRC